jgi:hypothetical protein
MISADELSVDLDPAPHHPMSTSAQAFIHTRHTDRDFHRLRDTCERLADVVLTCLAVASQAGAMGVGTGVSPAASEVSPPAGDPRLLQIVSMAAPVGIHIDLCLLLGHTC